MPLSAIVSETLLLQTMWVGSLVLSLSSIIVMAWLILRRAVAQRREKKSALRSREISRCLYAALKSPVALTANSLPAVKAKEYASIMRTALDRLRSLRGNDTHQIVAVLELWNMRPYILRIADSGKRGSRIQALTLLSYFSDDESLLLLLKNTNDSDVYVQISALRGLALRGAVKYITQIVESISNSEQTNTLMLSDILQRFGEPAVPMLLKLAMSSAKLEVRISSLMALGSIGSHHAVDGLITLIDNQVVDVRAQAISALGKIGDIRVAGEIAKRLIEGDPTVRLECVQALGKLRVPATMPQLADCLADDNWRVRFETAQALHRFGRKGVAALKAFSVRHNRAGLIARQVLGEHVAAS